MKKKYFLMALLPMIIGCNPTNSNSSSSSSVTSSASVSTSASSLSVTKKPLDLEETLKGLQKGVKVSSDVKEVYGDNINYYYFQNTSKEREFSFIRFKDESRTQKVEHEYYAALEEEDNIYATRLDVSNTYNYYEVYNPATYEFYTWNDGYNNAFLSLTKDSFEKIDDYSFKLKNDLLIGKSDECSTLFYGNPGLSLTGLTLLQVDNELHFESTFEFNNTSNKYSYEITAKVLAYGESTQMDYRHTLFDEVEDTDFDKMIQSLKANNYSVTIENYEDDILDSTYYYYTKTDSLYFDNGEYKIGYYEVGDGTIQEVENKEGAYYKVGSPEEANLDMLRPTFNLSRSCFDKLDNYSYTLKNDVEGSMTAVCVLESYAYDMNEFTITLLEDGSGYQFTNILNSYKTVLTFSDVGTTELGFTKDTVLEPVVSTSWSDVVDESSYQLLVDIAGEEAANIPVPENYSEWYQLSEESEFVFFAAEASSTIDDDIYSYYLALMDAGYLISEEEGLEGGVMALKEIIVNDESHVLVVEFLENKGMFCILVYIGE